MSRVEDAGKRNIRQGVPNHLQVWREIFVDFQHQNRDYFLPHRASFWGMIACRAVWNWSCEAWEGMPEKHGEDILCGRDIVSFTETNKSLQRSSLLGRRLNPTFLGNEKYTREEGEVRRVARSNTGLYLSLSNCLRIVSAPVTENLIMWIMSTVVRKKTSRALTRQDLFRHSHLLWRRPLQSGSTSCCACPSWQRRDRDPYRSPWWRIRPSLPGGSHHSPAASCPRPSSQMRRWLTWVPKKREVWIGVTG